MSIEDLQQRIRWLDLYLRLPARWHMKDYPDEEACLDLLKAAIWPDGPRCRACQGEDVYPISTRREWECRTCGNQFSPFAKTIFKRTTVPVQTWCILVAIMIRAEAKNRQRALLTRAALVRALGVSDMTARRMAILVRADLLLETGSILTAMLCTDHYEIPPGIALGTEEHAAALINLASARP